MGIEHEGQRLGAGDSTIDGRRILEGHIDERQAGTRDLDRHIGKQVGDRASKGGGHVRSLLDHLAELGGGMRHPEHDRWPAAIDPHCNRPDAFLERERGGIRTDQSLVEEHPAGTNRRMAGKRQLDVRRKDPDFRGTLTRLSGQDKRRLREVRFPSDGLHLPG